MEWEAQCLECDEVLDDDDFMSTQESETSEMLGLLVSDAPWTVELSFEEQTMVALEDRDVDAVYRAMLRQELLRPDFSKQYEYLKYRRVLVDWMAEVGETHLRMRKEYVHAAVGYLEKVLARDAPLPRKDRFQLLALSCLRVALKFLGTDEELPPMAEFWEMGNRMYSHEEISDAEADIFQKLGWNLTMVTPLHFLQHYMGQTVLFADDQLLGSELVDEAHGYYCKYAEFFVDLVLQEYSLQVYRPSVLAASVLVASRKALGVTPLWRDELSVLTGYDEKQVAPCFQALWEHFEATFGPRNKNIYERDDSPSGVTEF
ncbi:hypothetical protein F441_13946 [Phytophthora nicotianae CJ01A1]|uniref:Cyclin N-terminal domain-containing protein n=12 Tax=Phytophthora nicotianae TaxID=4792 RepID=W2PYA1_PHYN3|nr:hypothetical protein PPTG_14721 [Phytophthora nicotianae INRA-310]ETI40652.1 hypothetical protein F443_14018 [Phytophthora nicotianae P1569]ETK80751.1 hypothetical protein L915_13662 [Phytophthora nicotianae]ETO69339.1 hypothetical protein F444_14050 [Phytophthora nicotianae P1976]ETP10409.1 hypothetical protein F441_13946 [Phytophthora nicotianae CJ01A1]ETP38584.1 hypothetical protein F442_13860 [Phytophthora nicotianae P10297]KUF86396.1 G2/mitotic-specific cyclin S13-7 [Phytophthora nico